MDNYSKDLQGLINDDGVNVQRTPPEILKAQLEAWDEVVEKLVEDEFFKPVIESQKAWAKRVGYYSLINDADYRARLRALSSPAS